MPMRADPNATYVEDDAQRWTRLWGGQRCWPPWGGVSVVQVAEVNGVVWVDRAGSNVWASCCRARSNMTSGGSRRLVLPVRWCVQVTTPSAMVRSHRPAWISE